MAKRRKALRIRRFADPNRSCICCSPSQSELHLDLGHPSGGEGGLDKYSSDPARKVVKGDKVKVFYKGEGRSDGVVIKVGKGKNKNKLTILFDEEGMEDTLEYDGDYVVVIDEESAAEESSSEEMEVDEPEEVADFSKLKVAELREECTKRDLDTKGVKAVLVKRLNEAVAGGASAKRSIDEVEGDVEDAPAAKKVVVEETFDFKKLKVAELKAECTKRGLDTKGVKAVLVKRLEEYGEGALSEEVAENDDEDEEVVDFKKMKVAELREECQKRDLDTKGVKAVLVKRLEENA